MADEVLPAQGQENAQNGLEPLGFSERKAYRELADTHADEQGMVRIAGRTLKRLLAQAEAIELHQRREKGLRELATTWTKPVAGAEGVSDDYQDAGMEVLVVLDDQHYGDPAYQEGEAEHDGQGWRTPYPPLRRS